MTDDMMPLWARLRRRGGGDLVKDPAEMILQPPMEHRVESPIGAGRGERRWRAWGAWGIEDHRAA